MNVIILGASTRAAAFSAHRAGLKPWCIDLFADADLQAHFPVRKVPFHDYPHGLFAALRDAPDGPVMYTGGLENYPELLATIDRPLWGNPPEVVRHVRSPYLVNDMLRTHGLPTLEARAEPPVPADRREWLLKPLRGSGGIGIRPYRGESFDPRVDYLQEHLYGIFGGLGVVFLGLPGRSAIPLGATSRLGASSTHALGWQYAGGIVEPMPLHPDLHKLGNLLAREFQVGGLFGIDVVYVRAPEVYADLQPTSVFLVEVNPRYTASVELLERTYGSALLELHRAVYETHTLPLVNLPQPTTLWGKGILYALQDFTFPQDGPWLESLTQPNGDGPFADIPPAGMHIERGKPILTAFASAATTHDCYDALTERLQALDRCLWP